MFEEETSIYEIYEAYERHLCEHLRTVPEVMADEVGLDRRCGLLFIDNEGIVSRNVKAIDYYGGFEYIASEHRKTLGDNCVLYSHESERVQKCIDRYNASKD